MATSAPRPLVAAPLRDRYPEPAVRGAKLTGPVRPAFAFAPKLGGVRDDAVDGQRGAGTVGAGIVAPPPRRIDGADRLGLVRAAGIALLALLLLTAAPRRPRGRHRHGVRPRINT